MRRRIVAMALALALLPAGVMAAPYQELVVGAGVTYIEGVHFDAGQGYETDAAYGQHEVRRLEATQTQVGASGFLGNVGWTLPGEWIQYTLQVETAGVFMFEAYIATGGEYDSSAIAMSVAGVEVGDIRGEVRDWQDYRWYVLGTAEMAAGTQVLRVDFPLGHTNLAAIRLTHMADWAEPGPGTPLAPAGLRFVIGQVQYTQNGEARTADAAPFIDPVHERTMVPLRVVAEALGAEVDWDAETRTVHIVRGEVALALNLDTPLPDGMGMPAIVNDRTFVPLAYVAQMLGADVQWDGDAQAVYVR